MCPDPDRRDVARPHAYDLFDDGRPVGRLEWRTPSRAEAGWYVTLPPRPPERITVDPAIEALARDDTSSDHDWELNAELSLTAVSDVRILEGELHEDALKSALRRIALLGGRVVAVFRSEPDSDT